MLAIVQIAAKCQPLKTIDKPHSSRMTATYEPNINLISATCCQIKCKSRFSQFVAEFKCQLHVSDISATFQTNISNLFSHVQAAFELHIRHMANPSKLYTNNMSCTHQLSFVTFRNILNLNKLSNFSLYRLTGT